MMNMKMKWIYLAVLPAILVGLNGCKDFLDTEDLSSDGLAYLCSNPTDARKMVNHIYAYFSEDSYTSRMSNNWNQNTDVEFAAIDRNQAIAHNDRRGIWALNAGEFGDILTGWSHNYLAIDFANQVIEGIEASEACQSGDKEMLQLLGEAYCLRAYRYFMLCNFWGDVPLALTPSKYGGDYNQPRVDKNIIYSHIIQDLINIEEKMLWAESLANGVERMNREFALGFAAKLAMFRAGYSMQEDGTMSRCRIDSQIEAVRYTDENGVAQTAQSSDDFYRVAQACCRKLIKLKDRALPEDFKNIFYTQINSANEPNGDVLFEIGFVQGGGGDVGWNIGLWVDGGGKGVGKTYTYLAPAYVCSFDTTDQRLAATCAPYKYITEANQNAMGPLEISPAKWCRLDMNKPSADKNTGVNWPILRYPDVLLMLAEANNELSHAPDGEAKEMLKRVRNRAFAKAADKAQGRRLHCRAERLRFVPAGDHQRAGVGIWRRMYPQVRPDPLELLQRRHCQFH
jgi:hypothetical protein